MAFVRAGPLIDKHMELYDTSKSFLEFLFKLCQIQPLEHRTNYDDVRINGRRDEPNQNECGIQKLNECEKNQITERNKLNSELEKCRKELELLKEVQKELDELKQAKCEGSQCEQALRNDLRKS
ncbi:hypothetical protein AVEN_40951-1 [Araneus ventricosus]|uniref:Uncharacterized protein n=1 Tax=Araneus ventricosus TaxID=182803 RepID=A0A4Y2FA14_ARAVE|nr:hypothetical protein AVEN_40951-1 [Araneus ventricosus]